MSRSDNARSACRVGPLRSKPPCKGSFLSSSCVLFRPLSSKRHDLSTRASLPSSRPHRRSRHSHPHSDVRHRPPRSRVPRCQMRPRDQTHQGTEPSNERRGKQSRATNDGSFYRRRCHRSAVGPPSTSGAKRPPLLKWLQRLPVLDRVPRARRQYLRLGSNR